MKTNNFIKIFIATILITRIFLYFIPRSHTIYTDNFHHLYIGAILIIVYALIKFEPLFPIGLGLIADEIALSPFYITDILKFPIAEKTFWQYWSPFSIISTTIVILMMIVIIKKYRK